MIVEWWPIHHGVAGSAVPGAVSAAAVTLAGDVPDEDLVGAERMPVRATHRRVGDPLPSRGLHQLAQHAPKPKPRANADTPRRGYVRV